MRILLLADSHGIGMDMKLMARISGSVVMSIQVSQRTSLIRRKYMIKLREVTRFRPDIVLLHTGHNDIMYHHVHNRHPTHLKYYFEELQRFCYVLRSNHPQALFVMSSAFPRTVGPYMDIVKKRQYNRLAVRFGAMVRSYAIQQNFGYVLNSELWVSIRQLEEHAGLFRTDGLHLTSAGQNIVADGWVVAARYFWSL
jgi:lysophospholipase L1-like esterase